MCFCGWEWVSICIFMRNFKLNCFNPLLINTTPTIVSHPEWSRPVIEKLGVPGKVFTWELLPCDTWVTDLFKLISFKYYFVTDLTSRKKWDHDRKDIKDMIPLPSFDPEKSQFVSIKFFEPQKFAICFKTSKSWTLQEMSK
jgi:hypothetical protein